MKLFLALALPALAAAGSPTFVSGAIIEMSVLSTLSTRQTQLVVADNSIFIGNLKYAGNSEPLLLTYPGNQGSVSFTSFHTTLANFQSLLVYPNEARAVEFTAPHSAIIPEGADPFGYTITASVGNGVTNNLLRYKDVDGWHACTTEKTPEGSYQLFFVGAGVEVPQGCVKVDLNTFSNGQCT